MIPPFSHIHDHRKSGNYLFKESLSFSKRVMKNKDFILYFFYNFNSKIIGDKILLIYFFNRSHLDYCPQAKKTKLPGFMNKVLLEHGYILFFFFF